MMRVSTIDPEETRMAYDGDTSLGHPIDQPKSSCVKSPEEIVAAAPNHQQTC